MCGPLVLFLGKHRYRAFYFIGRTLSFTLAGTVAGGLGAVLQVGLKIYHFSAFVSFLFGGMIFLMGLTLIGLGGNVKKGFPFLMRWLQKGSERLSLILLQDRPWAVFLFGFGTLFLPCGQTVVVFSACALSQEWEWGMLTGFCFALFTSPSLWLAMRAHHILYRWRGLGKRWIGMGALGVGVLGILRGFADLEWISHWVLNPESDPLYHIILY